MWFFLLRRHDFCPFVHCRRLQQVLLVLCTNTWAGIMLWSPLGRRKRERWALRVYTRAHKHTLPYLARARNAHILRRRHYFSLSLSLGVRVQSLAANPLPTSCIRKRNPHINWGFMGSGGGLSNSSSSSSSSSNSSSNSSSSAAEIKGAGKEALLERTLWALKNALWLLHVESETAAALAGAAQNGHLWGSFSFGALIVQRLALSTFLGPLSIVRKVLLWLMTEGFWRQVLGLAKMQKIRHYQRLV